MTQWLYHATEDAVSEMLDGGGEFNRPERLLADLTEEQATRLAPNAPYTLAQVVAHMLWAQSSQLAHQRGEDAPGPAHLDDTFAPPARGAWPGLVAAFLAGVEECRAMARQRPAATSPDRDDTSVTYDLAEQALHNAYHLGQVVLLRRLLGLWPPAGGDANDY